MKRVLASASIFTAIMAATTGMAMADADSALGDQVGLAQIAEPSAGSSDLLGNVLNALSTGSAAECDGVMLDACVPLPAQP
ncbi:hypothetical protein ACWF82_26640 [Nocardia sp. NPDC055053]